MRAERGAMAHPGPRSFYAADRTDQTRSLSPGSLCGKEMGHSSTRQALPSFPVLTTYFRGISTTLLLKGQPAQQNGPVGSSHPASLNDALFVYSHNHAVRSGRPVIPFYCQKTEAQGKQNG